MALVRIALRRIFSFPRSFARDLKCARRRGGVKMLFRLLQEGGWQWLLFLLLGPMMERRYPPILRVFLTDRGLIEDAAFPGKKKKVKNNTERCGEVGFSKSKVEGATYKGYHHLLYKCFDTFSSLGLRKRLDCEKGFFRGHFKYFPKFLLDLSLLSFFFKKRLTLFLGSSVILFMVLRLGL